MSDTDLCVTRQLKKMLLSYSTRIIRKNIDLWTNTYFLPKLH